MKETNEYRILEDMGLYYPQRKHIGLRGKEKWKNELEWDGWCVESYRSEVCSRSRLDIERWLAAKIAERKLEAELKARGPVVVREIRA